jgi:hypothetical protein
MIPIRLLASLVIAIGVTSMPVLACKCVPPPPNISAHDLARWHADRTDAIFEGKVESIELKWSLMDAKVGDLLPADLEEDAEMRVSFEVARSYRGVRQKSVVVSTGLGGGDCGFRFKIGQQYLVYAFADGSGQLSTNICSGTAPLDDSQANLSYLRGESLAVQNGAKRGASQPGKLCGRLVRDGFDFSDSKIFLHEIEDKSPVPSDEAELAPDGSFCADGLAPGKYSLIFVNPAEESPTSFVFFPGVVSSADATAVEVRSGQTNSGLLFKVPAQPTFSVRGWVRPFGKSALPAGCKVALFSADALSFGLAYSQDVAPDGSFDFPQVLPGRYIAFASADSDTTSKWRPRKAEVNVEASVANLSLEIVAE